MAIPFLSNIDLNKNQLLNHTLHNATTDPSTPNEGQIYYNTTSDQVLVYNGSAWVSIAGDIESIATTTSNQLTVTNGTGPNVSLAIQTGAVADGGTALATGDQIYNFVTGLGYVESVAGGTYLTNSGTATAVVLDHDDTSRTDTTSTDTPAYGGTFEAVTSVSTNAQGHVTAIDVSTVTIPASDNTDVDVSVANLITRLGQISENVTIGDADDVTVIIPGNLQVTGETTFINETILVAEDNTIAFEGTTSGDNLFIKLTSAEPTTASKTITLPDLSGHVALLAAAATETITATPAELNLLDGITVLSGDNTGDEPDATRTVKGIVELANSDETRAGTDTTRAVTPDGLAARTVVATIDVSDSTLTGQTAPYKATIEHALNTKDLIVQLQDVTTFEVIHADISTVDFAGSESTTKITIGFNTALPSNDIRVIITSGAGATSVTPTYA